jgi:acyl CoA:acetate/3-ketoacid CoA transferase beta subunit
MEASKTGEVTKWVIHGKLYKSADRSMDLAAKVKEIVVLLNQISRDGAPKFRKECTLPPAAQT